MNLVASAPTRDEGVKLALDAILEATDTESGTVHLLPLGEAVMQLAASKNIPPVVIEKVRLIPVRGGDGRGRCQKSSR